MADLAVFLEKDFDPEAYINAACANKPSEQALDRHLADLEMKLHLGSEDIGLYLQDQAVRATQRIPLAARELARIREDAQGVRASVSVALSKLQDSSSQSSTVATALASLEEIDGVKQRMDAACSTLKEAAGLSTLFHLVEDLFVSGDLPRVADALAGIRRGLAVVADSVPEFRDGKQRLSKLEDRFSTAVEAPLSAALANQRGEEASSFAGMLLSMGRGDQAAKAYVSARSAPLWALWEGYTPGTPFVSWISTFYDQLLHSVAGECQWCSTSLPEQYPHLVLGLFSSFFESIDKPHRARLAGALTGVQGSLLPLEHLDQATAAAADFINGLRQELASAGAWDQPTGLPLLHSVIAPVEGAILQYHDKELQYLTAELPRLLAAARDPQLSTQELPIALSESVEPAFGAINASVGRCMRLTNGTALPALSRVLDRALQQYITAVQSIITTIHGGITSGINSKGTKPVPGGPGSAMPVPNQAAKAPEAVLPLLMLVHRMKQRLEESTSGVISAAESTVAEVLQAPATSEMPEDQPLPLASLRLEAQPTLRQQLATFNTSATAPLAAATTAMRDLASAVDFLVEKALCSRVAGHFATVPGLPEWQARPATSVQIPTFTPYPLQYVTAAGEYLMMLPQLVESSLASEGSFGGAANEGGALPSPKTATIAENAVAAQLVAEWVDRAALASAQLYLDELKKVKGLSSQGAGQLAADIEYFSNVLGTLGLGAPPAMAAWQAALLADADALEPLRGLAAGDGGSAEAKAAVDVVARLRGMTAGKPSSPH